jgi:isopentenyldiphosphate isomerase
MAFLDHIRRCNAHDLSQFTPWHIAGRRAGWVHHDFAPELQRPSGLFEERGDGWHLAASLDTPERRTEAVEAFLLPLREQGLVKGWRGEHYPVTPDLRTPPWMAIERAAAPLFGVRAFGVHMTGFVRRNDGLHVWVPRRARDKPTYPGMLDNTVAGGQPVGISLHDNIVKECFEEAGIPPDLAREARSVGFISYACQSGIELKPDIQQCFDLELPANFVPQAQDGEVESFELWPVQRVYDTVRDTFDFKYNCNLVLIDFFVRHGLIPADDPDWFDIAAGLHSHPYGPGGAG